MIPAVNHFRLNLLHSKFIVYTDHKALTWLKTIKHNNPRLIRWALKLQEYSFEIKHRPGMKHQNCEALSSRLYSEHANSESVEDNLFT